MSTWMPTRRRLLQAAAGLGAAGITTRWGLTPARAAEAADGWQIGCYTRPWDEHDYRIALDAIREAGYRHVGLMTTQAPDGLVISVNTSLAHAQRVGEEVRQRELKVASVYGGVIPVNQSLQAGIDAMRRLVDSCQACGAANLLMGGITQQEWYDRYYQAIAAACDDAAERGIGISLKPHGGLNTTGPQCRKAVQIVQHDNFRIWYDPGNIFYYSNGELDPVDDAPAVDGLVIGMSVKDYRHPRNVAVTPGTGQVDFPKVMAKLKAGGFTQGPLVVECLAPGDLAHLLREARKAKAFLEELVAETE